MLDRITRGEGKMEDLDKMEELCYYIKENALCGLGQTAPNPVLSTLKYFRDEYEAHVKEKRCPAGVCKHLLQSQIAAHLCRLRQRQLRQGVRHHAQFHVPSPPV